MTTAQPVVLVVSDGIAHIKLNQPDTGNALTMSMATALHDTFLAAAKDDAVRVVLLSGEGRIFCGGGDLRQMQAAPDRGAFVLALAHAAHSAVRVMSRLEKPLVAAVQGSAAGAGLSLVLLSDIVVATQSSVFVTAYTKVGLTPDCGQSWLLPRAVGVNRALRLTLESPRINATDAQALGIVSHVVEDGSLIEAAWAIALRHASGPSHANGAARALIRNGYANGLDAHLDLEAQTISTLASTDATGNLIDNFLDPKS